MNRTVSPSAGHQETNTFTSSFASTITCFSSLPCFYSIRCCMQSLRLYPCALFLPSLVDNTEDLSCRLETVGVKRSPVRDKTLKMLINLFFCLFANSLFCYDSFFLQPLTCSIVQIPLSTFLLCFCHQYIRFTVFSVGFMWSKCYFGLY